MAALWYKVLLIFPTDLIKLSQKDLLSWNLVANLANREMKSTWLTRDLKGPYAIKVANVRSTRDRISQKELRQTVGCKDDSTWKTFRDTKMTRIDKTGSQQWTAVSSLLGLISLRQKPTHINCWMRRLFRNTRCHITCWHSVTIDVSKRICDWTRPA